MAESHKMDRHLLYTESLSVMTELLFFLKKVSLKIKELKIQKCFLRVIKLIDKLPHSEVMGKVYMQVF